MPPILLLALLGFAACSGDDDGGPDVHMSFRFSPQNGCVEQNIGSIALVLETENGGLVSCSVLDCDELSGTIEDLARGEYRLTAFALNIELGVLFYTTYDFKLDLEDKDIGPIVLRSGSLDLNFTFQNANDCAEAGVDTLLFNLIPSPEYGADVSGELLLLDEICAYDYGVGLYEYMYAPAYAAACGETLTIPVSPLGRYQVEVQGIRVDESAGALGDGAVSTEGTVVYEGRASGIFAPGENSISIDMVSTSQLAVSD